MLELVIGLVLVNLLTQGAWLLDNRRQSALLRDVLSRVSTSPRIEIRPHDMPIPTAISAEPTYVSDLPYHDDTWDEFVAANEATEQPDEDES